MIAMLGSLGPYPFHASARRGFRLERQAEVAERRCCAQVFCANHVAVHRYRGFVRRYTLAVLAKCLCG